MYVHFFNTRRTLIVFSSMSLILTSCFNSGGGTSGGSNQSSTTQNTSQNTSSIQDESQVQAQRVNQLISNPTPVSFNGSGLPSQNAPSLHPPTLKTLSYSSIGDNQSYECNFPVSYPPSAKAAPTYFVNGKLCLASDNDNAGNTVGCANDDILVGPRKKLVGSSLRFTGSLPPVTINSSNAGSLDQYSVICKSRLFHAPKDSGAPVNEEPTAKKFLPVFRLPGYSDVFGDFAKVGSCNTMGSETELGKQEGRYCKFKWNLKDNVKSSLSSALSSLGYEQGQSDDLNACISTIPFIQNNPSNNASAQSPASSQVKCAPLSEIMAAGIQLGFSSSNGYRLPADVGQAPKFSYSLWLLSPQHMGPDPRAHTYIWSNGSNAQPCTNQDISESTCGIASEPEAPLINGAAQWGNYLLR